jgi:hypothetical protein
MAAGYATSSAATSRAASQKFVVRPLAPVASWTEEATRLADAILDVQM